MSVDISLIDVQRNVKTLKELLDFVILKIYSFCLYVISTKVRQLCIVFIEQTF